MGLAGPGGQEAAPRHHLRVRDPARLPRVRHAEDDAAAGSSVRGGGGEGPAGDALEGGGRVRAVGREAGVPGVRGAGAGELHLWGVICYNELGAECSLPYVALYIYTNVDYIHIQLLIDK